MRYILILLFVSGLYAQSCYTVQIISVFNSKKNHDSISSQNNDESCRLIEVGKTLTIRCGCHKKLQDARKKLSKYKKRYNKAYVTTTDKDDFRSDIAIVEHGPVVADKSYSINKATTKQKKDSLFESNFETIPLSIHENVQVDKVENNRQKLVQEDRKKDSLFESNFKIIPISTLQVASSSASSASVVTTPIATTPIVVHKDNQANKIKYDMPKSMQNEQLIDTMDEDELSKINNISVVDVKAKKKKKKNKKNKKKNKKKKNKKNKKKKNEVKYTKKRTGHYTYSRYLDKLENKDGITKFDYKYRFGAQVSYDIAYVYESDMSYLTSHWRRVRVYHKGSFLDERLFYELEYSFTGGSNYKDVFMGYKDEFKSLNTNLRIKYGNIKIPFSLERYTSSKYITFMERSLSDAFADGRKLGAELLLSTKLSTNRINLFASVFSNSIDERIDDDVNQPGYSMRLTYAHKFSKNHIFSIGGAFMYQDIKGEDTKFSQASESELMRDKYISTTVKDVDNSQKTNIEALYIYNKYSLQAEYTRSTLSAVNYKKTKNPTYNLKDYNFEGYYIQGSYFIVGTGRRYKLSNSTIGKARPKKEGAVEFAFRYSYLNLNDKDEQGGTQTDYNYGINWYVNDELRFMLNYIVAEPKGTDDYNGRLQILQARALFAF